jgi:ribosome-binding ATPase
MLPSGPLPVKAAGVHSGVVKLGIIGFPQSGKTTLFNLLTGAQAVSRAASRGTLHVGVARVPDERVGRLSALFRPERTVYATVDVVDLGGLERGERAGLDVGDLRSADALLHVVRGFPSSALGDPPDPARETQGLEEELILADLEVVERRLEKLGPGLKRKATETEQRERELLARLRGPLEDGVPLRAQPLSADESRLLRGYQFLSLKPILHCLNLAEDDVAERERRLAWLAARATQPATAIGWVSARVEAEVAALPEEEQRAFLEALGLPEPALHRVIRDAYALLGLATFFTVGEDEVRAWTIPAGASAVEAASAVHSDIARGFIRAEVISWGELLDAGSLAEARRRGTLRLEGKDYPVKDGEICHFRFNVGR